MFARILAFEVKLEEKEETEDGTPNRRKRPSNVGQRDLCVRIRHYASPRSCLRG